MNSLRMSIGVALALAGCSTSSPVASNAQDDAVTEQSMRDDQAMAGAASGGGTAAAPTSEQNAGSTASDPAASDSDATAEPMSPGDSETGGGGMTSGSDAGSNEPTGDPPPSELACLVAVQLDSCCQDPVAASADAVAADECFVPYRLRAADAALVERCRALQEPRCATVRCREPLLVSRRAEPDAAGACVLVDECEQDSDCILASDAGYCCSCPDPWPRTVVESDPCIVADGTAPPDRAAELCFIACNLCGGCAEPEPAVCRNNDVGPRTCGQL